VKCVGVNPFQLGTWRERDAPKQLTFPETAHADRLDVRADPNVAVISDITDDRFPVSSHKESVNRVEMGAVSVNPDLAHSRTLQKRPINFCNRPDNRNRVSALQLANAPKRMDASLDGSTKSTDKSETQSENAQTPISTRDRGIKTDRRL
jgi:hypothetical protein